MLEKEIITACAVTQKIYGHDYEPLTVSFARESYDQAYEKGAFDNKYSISHGICPQGNIMDCWDGKPNCGYKKEVQE